MQLKCKLDAQENYLKLKILEMYSIAFMCFLVDEAERFMYSLYHYCTGCAWHLLSEKNIRKIEAKNPKYFLLKLQIQILFSEAERAKKRLLKLELWQNHIFLTRYVILESAFWKIPQYVNYYRYPKVPISRSNLNCISFSTTHGLCKCDMSYQIIMKNEVVSARYEIQCYTVS